MNTYRNDQYTVTTSLNADAIHIQIANNISYVCHEGVFDITAFRRLSFGLAGIFKLMNKCFAALSTGSESNYVVIFAIEKDNILRLEFRCAIEECLDVEFDLRLREKVGSKDAQSVELNEHAVQIKRMIQTETELREKIRQQKQAMIEMESKMNARLAAMETVWEEKMQKYNNVGSSRSVEYCDALGHAEICFMTFDSYEVYSCPVSYPINSKTLVIRHVRRYYNNILRHTNDSYAKLKYFYQLSELTIDYFQGQPGIIENGEPHVWASSITVKKLTIQNLTKFKDIAFIQNFPQLEDLTITGIAMMHAESSTLRSINHKLKTLTFNNCTNINITEMQAYCAQNKIQLYMS